MLNSVRAPQSHPVPIAELRPTQITVGMREVCEKANKLKLKLLEDGRKVTKKTVIPVVAGPKDRFYVIDHHHLCRALLEAGVEEVLVIVVLKLQRLEKSHFWVFMDNRGLVHPFDEHGERCEYREIPKSIADLRDDPFRSVAGELRRRGGFAKDTTPFSEFLWADYLRRNLDRKKVEHDFEAHMEHALELARSRGADFLPGWCGPVEEEV